MDVSHVHLSTTRPTHSWLRRVNVSFVPGQQNPLLANFSEQLLGHFRRFGHTVQPEPNNDTDIILTTAPFGEPLSWRNGLLFTARRRFGLDHLPTLFTLVQATPDEFHQALERFQTILSKEQPSTQDFEFPGLAPQSYRALYEQGCRGGALLALARLVQAQSLSIRVILVVGDDSPLEAYTFDLVGAHPRTSAADAEAFYEDILLRMVTAASTGEITAHQVVGEPVPQELWRRLATPAAMRRAGREFGARQFFTEMIRVASLVQVPAVDEAVARQYSEGCFATWDPVLEALVATITGSARPVEKDNLTDDELAVIVAERPDGLGALVRHVDGKRNDPPSSEAVELIKMDEGLPRLTLPWLVDDAGQSIADVPVARSKLHGHRGVRAYDPERVEHVRLDEPYYHYPVSCSTEAQARAIQAAFNRSEALRNPSDQRQVVFTILPGHGIVIAEKWVPGKEPFQLMWEFMDAGYLEIENLVPQGPLTFVPGEEGRMVLQTWEWEEQP